jgi:hypothetical protein
VISLDELNLVLAIVTRHMKAAKARNAIAWANGPGLVRFILIQAATRRHKPSR